MNEKKMFRRALLALVLPITIQNFLTSAVNFADVFMLGFVGQDALSAVSLANQYQFILTGLLYGISSGITMLCSQYWGKKDMDSIQTIMGIALKIGMTVTAIIAVLALVIPRQLMLVYTNDTTLIEIGVTYLRIIGLSYFIQSFSNVYESTLRSVERARLSTIISGTALILNVCLNAVFIFGLFGAPKLGVLGVALATLIARIVECALCMGDLFSGKIFRPSLRQLFGRNEVLFKDFLKYSLPALANDIIWTLAFTTYSIILGHLSSDVVAANAIATNVRDLCTVLCFGISGGGSVLLGKTIGEHRMKNADVMAGRLCKITFLIGVATAGVILALVPLIPHLFTLTEAASRYTRLMLFISSYYVIGQAMNTLLIAGVFRAGGNSRFGLICDCIVMWGISVPLGFLSAFVFHAPPMVVYFILCLDEFWKLPVVIPHYRSKKWLKDITRDFS
ncbi:MAG: MATE family efflux transporter [Clostridiales bacterium]|nr:MATE family efflux transporter [Clostridiales bacterium]MCD8333482.1 MATE family efflux transporter [Clostridiales bacterium]